jgi:hypothetical protein
MAAKGHTIMIVRTHAQRDGAHHHTAHAFGLGDVGFGVYRQHADELQRRFDQDADPVRVYVCFNGMPDYAALMPWAQTRSAAKAPQRNQRRQRYG